MKFNLLILGSNSAFPAFGRFPSSQVIQHNEKLYLIDCGEGTQLQLSKYHVKRTKIEHIFISHLHGDHVFGLPGLITSYAQLNRRRPLNLYGPKGLEEMMRTVLRLSESRVEFDLIFHEIATNDTVVIHETDLLTVTAFPLNHRVETYGYRFQEKPRLFNVDKQAIRTHQLTTEQILDLKSGHDIELNGKLVPFVELTLPPEPLRSYCYCSDTTYSEALIPHIQNCTLLYHETTFMDELGDLAEISKHSTTKQAARIALQADVQKLVTGHYSSRYRNLEPLIEEVRTIFPSAELGVEGKSFEI